VTLNSSSIIHTEK